LSIYISYWTCHFSGRRSTGQPGRHELDRTGGKTLPLWSVQGVACHSVHWYMELSFTGPQCIGLYWQLPYWWWWFVLHF